RLGDQGAEPSAELLVQRSQFPLIGGRIEGPAAHADVAALLHGEADEAYAWVAVMIGLGAGNRAGQALLPVKALARGQDHVTIWLHGECAPEGFLNRLRSG